MAASTIPANILQKVLYSGYQTVLNRRKPDTIDRKAMPWLSFTEKRKKNIGQMQGSVVVKLKKNGGLDIQWWTRRDRLAFGESAIELELEYPWYNSHVGLELVHEDMLQMGYAVTPNGPRGKNFAKPLAEDDATRLVDYVEEQIEDMLDTCDVKMDLALLRDGSYDTKAIVGLDGLLTMTPTTGNIGGKSRANPLLQHTVYTGATVTNGGTLRTLLTRAKRNANLNSRGTPHKVDFLMCGSSFLEGFVAYATANSWQVRTEATGTPKLDIGIPESGYEFEGLPLVFNPSFDILDTIESPSVPWAKRCYGLASKTFHLGMCPGLDKFFSAPMDPADERVSRLSVDNRNTLICTNPNANFIVSIA